MHQMRENKTCKASILINKKIKTNLKIKIKKTTINKKMKIRMRAKMNKNKNKINRRIRMIIKIKIRTNKMNTNKITNKTTTKMKIIEYKNQKDNIN